MSEWIERIKNTAKSDKKTIVLPEGYDPRVIEAAKKVIDEQAATAAASAVAALSPEERALRDTALATPEPQRPAQAAVDRKSVV